MFKLTTVILLSTLMISLSVKDIVTYVNFVINNDYIIDNYCVNKETPELLCSGRCYLNESLEDNHDENDGMTREKQERTSTTFSYLPVKEYLMKNYIDILPRKKEEISLINFYSYTIIDQIFHPPQ